MEQETHSLFYHILSRSYSKSRRDFVTSVKPPYFPQKAYDVTAEESKGKWRLGMVGSNEEPAMTAPDSHGNS